MSPTAKVLIPDREWLIKNNQEKIGSIIKSKNGYIFFHKGKMTNFDNLAEITAQFGISIFDDTIKKIKESRADNYNVYNFPCSSKPFNPMYDVKQKLPLYAKSNKSKSQYCAGYYIIKFKKGWVKSACPKLITLERYPYQGPFKSETDMKAALNIVSKPCNN